MRRVHDTIESEQSGGEGGGGWGSPPGGGGWGSPPGGPPPEEPSAGDDGGAPESEAVEIGTVFETFRLLLARSQPGLLGALGTVLGVSALLQLPQWVANIIAAVSPASALAATPVSVCAGCIGFLGSVAVAVVLAGLFRPVRRLLLEGPGAAMDVRSTLRAATQDWVPLLVATLVLGVAVGFGSILCIVPGLVAAFFLGFVPYLVSTQGMDIWASLTRSVELATKHVAPLLVAVVLFVAAMLAVGIVYAVVAFVLTAALGPSAGPAFAAPIMFVLMTGTSYLGWLFFASTLVTIDAAESGIPIARG